MGTISGSLTKGAGNVIGMVGEILVHKLVGGERVGHLHFDYDILLDNKLRIDVKTILNNFAPQPHYVARVYGSESRKDYLATKCDVYFFARCNSTIKRAWIVGWMWADEFIERATFMPKNHVNPDDGRQTYHDEFSVPISSLNPPGDPITPRDLRA